MHITICESVTFNHNAIRKRKSNLISTLVVLFLILMHDSGFANCDLVIGLHEVNIAGLDRSRLIQALYRKATFVGSMAHCMADAILSKEDAQEIYKKSIESKESKESEEPDDKIIKHVNGRYLYVDLSKDTLNTEKYNKVNGRNAAEQAICNEFHRGVHYSLKYLNSIHLLTPK